MRTALLAIALCLVGCSPSEKSLIGKEFIDERPGGDFHRAVVTDCRKPAQDNEGCFNAVAFYDANGKYITTGDLHITTEYGEKHARLDYSLYWGGASLEHHSRSVPISDWKTADPNFKPIYTKP